MRIEDARFQIVARGPGQVLWNGSEPFDTRFAERDADVNRIWEQAREQSQGRLFNGTFLNCIAIDQDEHGWTVRTHFEQFKYLIAHRLEPHLRLPVTPVGVSGVSVLRTGNREWAVVARRAHHMTQYPGYLELVPSGTIDAAFARPEGNVDIEGKLLEEFEEETTLSRVCVKSIATIGLVFDIDDNNYDVCCRLELECDRAALEKGIIASGEYLEPQLVAWDALDRFAHDHQDDMIPSSLAIVCLLGL